MAILTAFDDGSMDAGETWRLRRSRTTIGRTNSDIEIAHDPDMSAEHAEIVRREQDGGHQWQLVDLNSTNGTERFDTNRQLRRGASSSSRLLWRAFRWHCAFGSCPRSGRSYPLYRRGHGRFCGRPPHSRGCQKSRNTECSSTCGSVLEYSTNQRGRTSQTEDRSGNPTTPNQQPNMDEAETAPGRQLKSDRQRQSTQLFDVSAVGHRTRLGSV